VIPIVTVVSDGEASWSAGYVECVDLVEDVEMYRAVYFADQPDNSGGDLAGFAHWVHTRATMHAAGDATGWDRVPTGDLRMFAALVNVDLTVPDTASVA
jgi:hypothetical protein